MNITIDVPVLDIRTPSEEGRPLVLIPPGSARPVCRKDGTPMKIVLRGRFSPVARDILRQIADETAAITQRGGRLTDQQRQDQNVRYLTAMTKGWNLEGLDGDIPCTPQNVQAFWSDARYEWVVALALDFVATDANFLMPSA